MEMEKLRVCLFRRNRSQQAAGEFWRFSFIGLGSFRSYFPEHAVAARYFDDSKTPRVNTGNAALNLKNPIGSGLEQQLHVGAVFSLYRDQVSTKETGRILSARSSRSKCANPRPLISA